MEVKSRGRWIDKLRTYAIALSEIKNYQPIANMVLEEEIVSPKSRRTPKKLPKAIEKEEIIDIKKIENPAPLRYFMDGCQRTILLGHILSKDYCALLPIQLHLSGVAIVDSRGRIVYGPEVQIKLIVPKKNILPKVALDILGNEIEETKDMGKPTYDYAELRKRGYEKSSHLRDELEQKALRNFKPYNGYLAYDGSIPNMKEFMEREDIIGIVKTHRMRYLKLEKEVKVFSMETGYRSWLFEIKRRELKEKKEYPICSCYLRLRKLGRDPLAGLVRVEINPSIKEEVDNICFSIFNERLPVQLGTRNWDRKLYPFYRCERVIQAHLPSHEALYGMFREVIR